MSGVRRALELYRTFQAKDPDFVTALDPEVRFPKQLGVRGRARRILYRSGKWKANAKKGFYLHDYESLVLFCEPWRPGLKPVRSPKWSGELVQLGDGVEVEIETEEGVRYPKLPRGTKLSATTNGRTLVLLHLRKGVLGALVGKEQRVTDRGIEG